MDKPLLFLSALIGCALLAGGCTPEVKEEIDPDGQMTNYVEVAGVKHEILAVTQDYYSPLGVDFENIDLVFKCSDLDLAVTFYCETTDDRIPAGVYAGSASSGQGKCKMAIRTLTDEHHGTNGSVKVDLSGGIYTVGATNCTDNTGRSVKLAYKGPSTYGSFLSVGAGSIEYYEREYQVQRALQKYYGDYYDKGNTCVDLILEGEGMQVELRMFCASSYDRLPAGTYTFNATGRTASTFCYGYISDTPRGEDGTQVASGSVTIVRNGEQYNIGGTLTGRNGETVFVTYSGTTGWYYSKSFWDSGQ